MTDKERKNLLDTPLADLNINQGIVTRLKFEGIITLRDLVRKTKRGLLGIHNIGKKTVESLEEKVEGMGLHLGMRDDGASVLSDERKRMLWECFSTISTEGFKEYLRRKRTDGVVAPAGMCAFYTVRSFEELLVRIERALAEHPDLFDYNLYGFEQIKGMLFPELGKDAENDD